MSEATNNEVQKESLLQTLMPVIVLTVICAISGSALAALKIGTAEQIENQLLANVQGPTLKNMFPSTSNDPIEDRKKFTLADGSVVTVFPVYENSQLTSVAIEGIGQGYGGDLGVMTAFNLDNGSLRQIGVTVSKETPGIGTKIQTSRYLKQFSGKSSVALRPDGGDIDGVSGATISSKGSVMAVQHAISIFTLLKPEIEKTWPAQM